MSVPSMSDRAFGLSFGALFGAIAGAVWLASGSPRPWLLGLAGGFAVLALVAPGLLLPANRLWGRIGAGIGRVTNLLLLALFYYGAILPTGLMIRLLRGDPANRHPQRRDGSFWRPVGRRVSPETLSDLF